MNWRPMITAIFVPDLSSSRVVALGEKTSVLLWPRPRPVTISSNFAIDQGAVRSCFGFPKRSGKRLDNTVFTDEVVDRCLKGRVRSLPVVVLDPSSDLDPGMGQTHEHGFVEQLVPHAAVDPKGGEANLST